MAELLNDLEEQDEEELLLLLMERRKMQIRTRNDIGNIGKYLVLIYFIVITIIIDRHIFYRLQSFIAFIDSYLLLLLLYIYSIIKTRAIQLVLFICFRR